MRKLHILTEIKNLISQLESSCSILDSKPRIPGTLRVLKGKKHTDYYFSPLNDRKSTRYLKKNELPFIKALAQQDYEKALSASYRKMVSALKKCEKIISQCEDPEEIFSGLIEGRRKLVNANPVDEEYALHWLETHKAPPSYFDKNAPVFITDDGLRIRSKSELLYIHAFRKKGVPFVYETRVFTKSGARRPDFLVLNKRTRKEYYIEHFGKMDDPIYVQNMLEKLKEYESVGIVLGVNLLVTFEAKEMPLDVETINKLIDRFLV